MIQNGNLRTTAGAGVRPSSRVARSEAIIFTELDGAVVMMDADAGSYYELDPVGARIWALLEPGPTVSEVCAALVAEYEVAPAACAEEVQAFLDELRRWDAIRVLPENGADDGETDAARVPEASSMSGRAWSTPSMRVMEVAQIASSTTVEITDPDKDEKADVSGFYNYMFIS